ncbi:MAG TPA: RNA polymerase sigma factor [Baekduia sp.]|nr:RNA polymerase sigma factor [Baekduia sp.]
MGSRLGAAALLRHLDVLHRVASELCDAQDAEDLVQETCLRVLTHPREVAAEQHLAYLCTALRNTHMDRCRRSRTQPVADGAAEEITACDLRAVPGIERLALRESLADLPEGQRATVLAVDLLGMPYAEAAAAMGVPTGTVMSRLHRARRTLADELGALAA